MTKAAPGHEELEPQEPGAEELGVQEEPDAAQPGEIDLPPSLGLVTCPSPKPLKCPKLTQSFAPALPAW